MVRTVAIHLHIITLLTLIIVAHVVLIRLRSAKREYFVSFLFCSFLYVLGGLFEIMATTVESGMIGRRIVVLGGQLTAPMFLMFTQQYCERRLPRLLNASIFAAAFFVIVLVWTSGWHTFVYTTVELLPEGQAQGLRVWGVTYGALITLVILLPAVCMALSLTLLIRKALYSNGEQRKRLGILIFCASIPGISVALPLLQYEVMGVYLNVLLIASASIAVYSGLFKYDLLENEETLRSQKIMREMIGNISHDLKTPLTVMSLNIEKLLHAAPGDPNYSRDIRIAYNKNLDLQRLVQNLIEVTRMQTAQDNTLYHPIWLSLNRLLSEVQAQYSDFMESVGLSFDVTGPGEDVLLYSDPTKLWHVFDNLIYNAAHYTKVGGTTVTTELADDTVIISVTDTGCGIAPEHLPQIFDRFYQVAAERDGPKGEGGLGLCIVKSVMEGCGGSVRIESELGRGTSVILTFRKKCKE